MQRVTRLVFASSLLASLCLCSTGCSLFSQVNYWLNGYKVDAKFNGMEKKRVAVVCVSADSVGPSGEASSIANAVTTILARELKDTTFIKQAEIADWMDKNDWNQVDYCDVGRGVKADLVIAIDLRDYTTKEGQTLLRGKAELTINVHDVRKNEVVYGPTDKRVVFPENGAKHITENEGNFRRLFIFQLAQQIAHDFYAYDRVDDFAKDSAVLNN